MNEEKNVSGYFTRIKTCTNQMRNCGEIVSDLMIIEKVLKILIVQFDLVATEAVKNLEELKVVELHGSLASHELRIKEKRIRKSY